MEINNKEIKLPVAFIKEGDHVIAYTPALDLSTQGKTLAEAKRNFHEAVELWFEACLEMGTLDEALLSLGWVKQERRRPSQSSYIPPTVIKNTEESFCIPA